MSSDHSKKVACALLKVEPGTALPPQVKQLRRISSQLYLVDLETADLENVRMCPGVCSIEPTNELRLLG